MKYRQAAERGHGHLLHHAVTLGTPACHDEQQCARATHLRRNAYLPSRHPARVAQVASAPACTCGHQNKNKPAVGATDFKILNEGSILLFCPLTNTAILWCNEHCPSWGSEHTYFGPNLVVEPRYAADLATNACNDGLTFS